MTRDEAIEILERALEELDDGVDDEDSDGTVSYLRSELEDLIWSVRG